MSSILERVATKRPLASSFQPSTERELFVLRLAQKLGEPAAAAHFNLLASQHSNETLLLAFRRAARSGARDLARAFHSELAAATHQSRTNHAVKLLAVKIERRSVAIAVFHGTQLDFCDVRQLSSQASKAEASTVGFLHWVLANLEVESAALERLGAAQEIRRALLNTAVLGVLRRSGIPVWEVAKKDLLEGFAYPAARSRRDLRTVVQTILWASLNTDRPHEHILDASALGLYVQTERLFLC